MPSSRLVPASTMAGLPGSTKMWTAWAAVVRCSPGSTQVGDDQMAAKSRASAAKRALRDKLTVTVEDAAALLGMSRNGAYDAVKANQIPHIRIGRCIRIPSAALRCLLKIEAGVGG